MIDLKSPQGFGSFVSLLMYLTACSNETGKDENKNIKKGLDNPFLII
jgi:hypothetical protein